MWWLLLSIPFLIHSDTDPRVTGWNDPKYDPEADEFDPYDPQVQEYMQQHSIFYGGQENVDSTLGNSPAYVVKGKYLPYVAMAYGFWKGLNSVR